MPLGNFEPPERVFLFCAGRHIQVGRKLYPPYGTHYDPGSGPIWLSGWAAAVLTWDEDWSAPDTNIDTVPLRVPTSGPGLRACMGAASLPAYPSLRPRMSRCSATTMDVVRARAVQVAAIRRSWVQRSMTVGTARINRHWAELPYTGLNVTGEPGPVPLYMEPAPAGLSLPLLVGPVCVATVCLSVGAGAVGSLALVAALLVAAVVILFAAALSSVMTDRAAGRGTKQAVVPGDMAGDPADCSAGQAACLRRRSEPDNGNAAEQHQHGQSLHSDDLRTARLPQ